MQSQTEGAKGIGTELLEDAKGVGATAVDRLHSEVDSRKGDAVGPVKSVSSAIGQASDSLDPRVPSWLKSALQQGARQVQTFADTLEQKDSRQLVSDVSDFAKKSPTTFLAACAAAGFAASRVFRAGGATPNTPSQPGPVGSPSVQQTAQSTSAGASNLAAHTQGEFA